ncbi:MULTISPECIES: DUF736 domain-containing protein [unclassified Novosphingobium]|uniref:DUF736 domain-containing protein n=1 Tax=unclassified Novosphingobium TaxID=2644732 RepID=UPI001494E773|nr:MULTISPECIES: DUF736 domain-containing protein [unclassified Novosphingobium]MBB3357051.1 uncharacterized protein (DUF736 family) [Novosphingobium sp. BK256]MBB3373452.1 uncharacterized protein (DUF736 family) [Novosphingobium sp. BK280]MBB3377821.1 uncharacterized protein (DUF736 family) [Novosphingobium sp. BK258]MBB3418768.1 uncharacterized protein (DUF736 family) [Novosphingobium sp. BK267]MBB3450397.1 uncharacterized protein (DUF736 family) [Novosphingobium sp. BK352]
MKIGNFKFDERASDIIGKIATREMRFPYLIMRRVEDRQSDSAPVYEIYETNRAGDEIQIGVVWERKMRSNDEVFLSGMIDDPSFREPLPIALFGDETNGFDVQWRRERERETQGGGFGGRSSGGRAGGGFGGRTGGGFSGGSTAGPDGGYTGGGRSLDDEVPF